MHCVPEPASNTNIIPSPVNKVFQTYKYFFQNKIQVFSLKVLINNFKQVNFTFFETQNYQFFSNRARVLCTVFSSDSQILCHAWEFIPGIKHQIFIPIPGLSKFQNIQIIYTKVLTVTLRVQLPLLSYVWQQTDRNLVNPGPIILINEL